MAVRSSDSGVTPDVAVVIDVVDVTQMDVFDASMPDIPEVLDVQDVSMPEDLGPVIDVSLDVFEDSGNDLDTGSEPDAESDPDTGA
jgi:hypothetical protein